jgi:hypothetical protein
MGSEGQKRPHALLLQIPFCLSGVGATRLATGINQINREEVEWQRRSLPS